MQNQILYKYIEIINIQISLNGRLMVIMEYITIAEEQLLISTCNLSALGKINPNAQKDMLVYPIGQSGWGRTQRRIKRKDRVLDTNIHEKNKYKSVWNDLEMVRIFWCWITFVAFRSKILEVLSDMTKLYRLWIR